MKTRFIPSQRIKGSDKELFIINYEGSTFEIQRTSNIYEPVIIRLNGALLDTIPSKQNKEIEFSTPAGKHKIQVWNERVENNLIPKIFVKDGIAAVIDGIPVQNTLSDPITRFKTGKVFIWLLTALLFLKAFIIPLTSQQLSLEGETRIFLFVNIILFILSLSAALTFQLNPLRSVWIALLVSLLEFASYILAIVAIKQIDIVVILFTILRLAILASLIFSLRNLKLILNFSDDEYQVATEKPPIPKKVKQFSFPKKYIAISLITLIILVGGYFAITEIIKSSKYPSIERDSSLKFRTDLKLPELIPYRKGDLWGYTYRNKRIKIKPEYSEVKFIDSTDADFLVAKNGLWGLIDSSGNKLIPFIYNDISRFQYWGKRHFYKVSQKVSTYGDLEGVVDSLNKIISPVAFSSIYYIDADECIILRQEMNVTIFYKNQKSFECEKYLGKNLMFYNDSRFGYSIKNTSGDIIYSGLRNSLSPYELNDNFIIVLDNELRRGVIDLEGNIIIPFNYDYDHISYFPDSKIFIIQIIDSNRNLKISIVKDTTDKTIFTFEGDLYPVFNVNQVYFEAAKKMDESSIKRGIFNNIGENIIPFEYDYLNLSKKSNLIIAGRDNKRGVIDLKNNVVIPFSYDQSANEFSDELLCVQKLRKSELDNYFDKEMKPEWSAIFVISNTLKNKNIVFDPDEKTNGKILENILSSSVTRNKFYKDYSDVLSYKDSIDYTLSVAYGLFWRDSLSNYGFIDKQNIMLYDFIFEGAENFENGLAIVKLKGKWGIINKNNQTVLTFKYDEIEKVKDYDLYKVKLNGKEGYVDLNGVEYFE